MHRKRPNGGLLRAFRGDPGQAAGRAGKPLCKVQEIFAGRESEALGKRGANLASSRRRARERRSKRLLVGVCGDREGRDRGLGFSAR